MSQLSVRHESIEEENRNAFRNEMLAVIRRHRLQYFVVTLFPEADTSGLIENMIATNWPTELLAKYEHTDMFRQSRIVAGLKKSIIPVCAESLLFARARQEGLRTELLGFYYDDGFSNTIGLSVHDAARHHYLMMLSGERKITSDDEIGLLILNAMRALDTFGPPKEPDVTLSDRELDCLRWSAAGKSSEEIAIILELSPHTVNDYLKAAMRKLGTVSRIQAVARASRLRLI